MCEESLQTDCCCQHKYKAAAAAANYHLERRIADSDVWDAPSTCWSGEGGRGRVGGRQSCHWPVVVSTQFVILCFQYRHLYFTEVLECTSVRGLRVAASTPSAFVRDFLKLTLDVVCLQVCFDVIRSRNSMSAYIRK